MAEPVSISAICAAIVAEAGAMYAAIESIRQSGERKTGQEGTQHQSQQLQASSR